MRIFQFDREHVGAGRIVAWRPCEQTHRSYAATTLDPRPPTFNQRAHLHRAKQVGTTRPHDEQPAPWIGFSCRLGNATEDSVASMLARYVDRHESLRSGFVTRDGGRLVRRTLPAGIVTFEPQVLAEYADADSAHDVAAAHLAAETHPLAWPSAAFVTVDGAEGTTLLAAFDHGTFDGYSAYLSVAELADLHRQAPPQVGSYVDFAVTEQELCTTGDVESGLERWSAALDEHRRLPALPSASGVRRGARHRHTVESHLIASPTETNHFIGHLRAAQTPVGVGFIALLVHALMLEEGSSRLTALMSTHNRATPALASAVGWFAGVAPMTVNAPKHADLAEVTQATAEAWDASQPAADVPLPLAAELLDAELEPSLVLSYINGRRCPGWEGWADSEAQVLLGPVAPGAQVHAWISCLPHGTYLEIRYPQTPRCTSWVHRLALSMRDELLDASTAFLPDAQGA
ncbi:condensation domain-containing protein [Luteipulveratus mongoliensis]|uniref:Condensation domain-containing protein n=1 Tax=Luteipulveratus mongoliensis TaxID=571913 RepID=A0A0K1JHI7_9MICO|nr:condensation domain-containing protein [Luteipulveratus mongoliensis]AKU16174.1 hypothetical protein VV02_10370 [Luteipulveratus mongoliensis]